MSDRRHGASKQRRVQRTRNHRARGRWHYNNEGAPRLRTLLWEINAMLENETITPETNPWNAQQDRGELPAIGDEFEINETEDPNSPMIRLRVTGWCDHPEIGLVPLTERVDGLSMPQQ